MVTIIVLYIVFTFLSMLFHASKSLRNKLPESLQDFNTIIIIFNNGAFSLLAGATVSFWFLSGFLMVIIFAVPMMLWDIRQEKKLKPGTV